MPNLYGATGSRTNQGRPGADSIDISVLVDSKGRVLTVPGPFAQSPSGLVRPRAANDGTQYITTGNVHRVVSAQKTRPADTTAYTANDVVADSTTAGQVWQFDELAPALGGSGYIVKAHVITDEVTGQTQRLRLYLYNAAPTGVLNDNAANTEPQYADRYNMIGKIDFDELDNSMGDADSSESLRDDLRLAFTCRGEYRTVQGILVTLDAFTPVSMQKFTITLEAE